MIIFFFWVYVTNTALAQNDRNYCLKHEEYNCTENESKQVLDAFFLGKAFAEALNERIESTVGEVLSTVGRLQAEQQKQIQEFQVHAIHMFYFHSKYMLYVHWKIMLCFHSKYILRI